MNINYIISLITVIVLFLIAYIGVEVAGLQILFGIFLPYAAFLIFIIGICYRVMEWAKSPVPFSIPTTCGQQKSLSWIKPNPIDNPTTKGAVIIRMIFEIFCFRSLFRNTISKLNGGSKLSYKLEISLWAFALLFHYSFLVVLLRHLRFFLEPVPSCIKLVEFFDGFMKVEFINDFIHIGLPGIYLSGFALLGAVVFLFARRVYLPHIRYISLASDFFPLFLIMGIAISGIFMRYFTKVDIVGVKELTMGLVTLSPGIPENVGSVFYVHMLFISVLMAYFPFSKLMHMAGVFLSPTRNLTTNTRAIRHINPWNYPVKIHTYAEYEDEFREKMIEAGLPVEKELK